MVFFYFFIGCKSSTINGKSYISARVFSEMRAVWPYITHAISNRLPAFRQNLLNFQSITG